MKIFSGSVRLAGSKRSVFGLALFLAVLDLAAGCSHKNEQSVATTSQPTTNSASPAASASPADPDLMALNRAVRKWMITNRAVPKNFDDFVARAGVSVPPPPPGKKYVLNQNMRVQLVDQ